MQPSLNTTQITKNIRLVGVPLVKVPQVWGRIFVMLKTAVDQNDGFTMDDVYNNLMQGFSQMWLADNGEIKGVAITQLINYPQKRTCLLLFTAGVDFDHWRHLLTDIESWAVSKGCKDIEFYGRRGWLKKDLGYKPTYVVFRKDLR